MDVNSYLDRIGTTRPAAPTADALRELHRKHLLSVPFENLGIHLGDRVDLAEDALLDKIVRRHRGGCCYELNGAFAGLLRELGFTVRLLSAKVAMPGGGFGPPFDHLTLRVELDEPWLADVGFGRFALNPLRLNATEPQTDPEGEFVFVDLPDGEIELRHDGEPAYRLEPTPRELPDFGPTCWWQETHPKSHFRTGAMCSMPVQGGRVTVAGDKLIRTLDGERTEQQLGSDAEILAAYREHFGFELDRVPRLS